MKKIIEFVETYGLIILFSFLIVIVVVGLLIPFFVALARLAWDVAINNPQALL